MGTQTWPPLRAFNASARRRQLPPSPTARQEKDLSRLTASPSTLFNQRSCDSRSTSPSSSSASRSSQMSTSEFALPVVDTLPKSTPSVKPSASPSLHTTRSSEVPEPEPDTKSLTVKGWGGLWGLGFGNGFCCICKGWALLFLLAVGF